MSGGGGGVRPCEAAHPAPRPTFLPERRASARGTHGRRRREARHTRHSGDAAGSKGRCWGVVWAQAGASDGRRSPMDRMLCCSTWIPDCVHSLKVAKAEEPPQVHTRPAAAAMQRTGP